MISIERHYSELSIPSLRFIGTVSVLRSYLLYDNFNGGPHNMDTIREEIIKKDVPDLTQSLIRMFQSMPSLEKFGSLLTAMEFIRRLPPTRRNLVTMHQYEMLCQKVRQRPLDLNELLIHAVSIDEALRSNALKELVCLLPLDAASALSFVLRLPWSAIARQSWLPLGTWLLLFAVRRHHETMYLDVLQDLLWVNHTLCEK